MSKITKNKWFKRILYTLGGIVVFLCLVVGVILFLYSQTTVLERAAVNYLNRKLSDKGTVEYKSIRGSLLNQIEIEGLEINIENEVQIKCNYLEVHYDLWRMIYNEYNVSKILIDQVSFEIAAKSKDTKKPDEEKKQISVDTTLVKIEESHIIDNILDRLPVIKVADLKISAASINIMNKDINISDIDLKIDRISITKNKYYIKLDKLSGYWDEKDVRLQSSHFQLTGNRDYITFKQINLNLLAAPIIV